MFFIEGVFTQILKNQDVLLSENYVFFFLLFILLEIFIHLR